MDIFHGFLKDLEQAVYIHALVNPMPVYGLAMGMLGLLAGIVARSRAAQIVGLMLVAIAALSA